MTRRDAAPRRPSGTFGEFDGALGGWTLDGEPYTSAPGDTFDWFRSRMLGGRTNHWGRISLRFGPDDFQRQDARRPRRRLADHLRRPQAVLRQDRSAHRHLRRSARDAERARRHLPAAAQAALLRAADQAGVRATEYHRASRPGLSILTQAAQRPAGVSLLRAMRPRLRDALELLVAVSADSAGARRPAGCKIITGAMAREVTAGRRRTRERRDLHRQADRAR